MNDKYIKTVWKNQDVENPRTYFLRENDDGSVTTLDNFGNVVELGTPVNADNMNKIENELEKLGLESANTNLDNLTSNELSGSVINLAQGFFYHTLTENTQYILPEPIAGAVNEIEVYINMSEVFAIDLGTSNFVNGEPLELNVVGSYTLIWYYDFTKNVWVVGGFKNGS